MCKSKNKEYNIMKKIYKKPSVKEVKLNASTLLADSTNPNVFVDPDGDPVNEMDSKGSIWYWMGEEN